MAAIARSSATITPHYALRRGARRRRISFPALMASFRHQGKRLAVPDVRERSARGDPAPRPAASAAHARARWPRRWPTAATASSLLDLLGHGALGPPARHVALLDAHFGEQVVALMDHLELDEAVVGGTSLGANVDARGRLAGARAPARHGHRDARARQRAARLRAVLHADPRRADLRRAGHAARAGRAPARPARPLPFYADVGLDWFGQDPGPSAAVIQGLFFGRIAPHRTERRTFETPALVIGHHRDPIHPFSDAGMLADELPNARLVEADSLIELRAGARAADRRDRRLRRRVLASRGQ